MKKLKRQNLVEIFDFIFSTTHSNGFKESEIKSLLFDRDYWFLEAPKENWKSALHKYLDGIGYDKSQLKINPTFEF